MKRYLIVSILTLIGSTGWAEIKLPAMVGDDMVLQRCKNKYLGLGRSQRKYFYSVYWQYVKDKRV